MIRHMLALTTLMLVVSVANAAVLCANPSGSVFVRETCKSNETKLDPAALGLVGPQGPAGATGPQGVAGSAGTPGAPGVSGVSGWEKVSTATQCTNVGFCNAELSCPPGKRVLGAGAQSLTGGGAPPGVQVVISASLPIDDDTWFAQSLTVPFTPLGSLGVNIFVVCANV